MSAKVGYFPLSPIRKQLTSSRAVFLDDTLTVNRHIQRIILSARLGQILHRVKHCFGRQTLISLAY